MVVIIIGASILAAEYFYFCNRLYTVRVIEEGDSKIIIKGRPNYRMKLTVGISILVAIYVLVVLGLLTKVKHRKSLPKNGGGI